MSNFGKPRSRRDVHNDYLANNGQDFAEPGQIGNVHTLSDFDNKSSGFFNSPAPPSPQNLKYKKNVEFLRSYFTDRTTHHFKNGLELANSSGNVKNVSNLENLDEDPVIFGFDFIINHVSSPLYQDLPSFFRFANSNGLTEVINRQSVYNDFIEHFELLFLSTRGGSFDTFKGHYLIGIDGLSDLINKSTGLGSDKQFADFGKDKITLNMREDVHLSGGYLSMLYNTLAYSKINGKTVIPDNLLRFDATIVISEIRNYKRIRRLMSSPEDSSELISVVNDSVSRYMYNVYDCQFLFNKHSHGNKVNNAKSDVEDDWELSFFYKYSDMEMEKFKYNPDEIDVRYLNDGNRVDPTRKYVGERSNDLNAVRRNEFINRGYQENEDQYYAIYGDQPTNNNIDENFSSSQTDVDEISALRRNSMIENLKEQEKRRNELIEQKNNANINNPDKLSKSINNVLPGYRENITDPEYPGLSGQNRDNREGGLSGIINRSKEFAIQQVKRRRNELINDTINNIRRATGIRRIGSPTNVYDDNFSIAGKIKNELKDFTNDRLTDLFGSIDDLI